MQAQGCAHCASLHSRSSQWHHHHQPAQQPQDGVAQLGAAVRQSIEDVHSQGWCAASWQPEVVAVATPLPFQGAVYALNMSVTTAAGPDAEAQRLAVLLLQLKRELEAALALSAAL